MLRAVYFHCDKVVVASCTRVDGPGSRLIGTSEHSSLTANLAERGLGSDDEVLFIVGALLLNTEYVGADRAESTA
jgi:hypothetical protein